MRLGTLANGGPINVGAYFLAGNAGQKFNIGAVSGWDIPGPNPPLNGLVAPHAKLLSSSNRPAEKSYGLGDRFVFVHESHFIQEKLATQGENEEKLVVTSKGRLNKFQPMKKETIHGRIKRLRLSLDMSHGDLAAKCGLKS